MAEDAYGLMRLDRALLALPVATLREVIPCPAELQPLPVPAPGLTGAVQLRGTIIPVLDLRSALGMGPRDDAAGGVIVLMRFEGRLLGLKACAVAGMARVDAERMHALVAAQPLGAGIATHSFETDDGVATLLDPARIAALPGMPMVAEPSIETRAGTGGTREPLLLFACGGLPLGVAAMSVDATVPRTPLRPSSLQGELCRGVIDHHGHEVPVLDTLKLLGLGELPPAEESAVVVLRFGRGLLGLQLDEVRDIARAAAAEILPLPPVGLPQRARLRGVLAGTDGEQHLLIDAAALQADELLAGLASMSKPKAAAAVAATGAAGKGADAIAGRAYLTYRIEVETASELTQATEIVPWPAQAVRLAGRHDATLGLFTHRGASVPLVCLCTLLGRPVEHDFASARVLLVEDEGERVGLVVQALCSIENARWEQPAGGAAAEPSLHAMRSAMQPLVEVGTGEQRRTLPRLDLQQLVRALRAESRGAAAPTPRPQLSMPTTA